MTNTKHASFVGLSFLLLSISLFILFSPSTGKAQNNSTVNLAGTSWVKSPQSLNGPGDGTTFTLLHSYIFETNGKVKYTLITTKPAGVEVVMRGYIPNSGEYGVTTKPTSPSFGSKTLDGTYEIEGRFIHLEFADYNVWAKIYGDSIKGELIYKSTNKREEWVVRRGTIQCEYTVPLCLIVAKQQIDNSKFSVPADSPMIGTWKYVEYSDKRKVIRTSTFIYSRDGVVESIHQVGTDTIETKNNWKYTAKSPNLVC